VQNYSMGLPKLGWTIPRTFPTRTPRGWGICLAAMRSFTPWGWGKNCLL
jgi:hypothetical protein